MDSIMPKRPELTPGRLYAMLSAEFREARARTCLGCAMPMVFACDRGQGAGANWSVEPLAFRCSRCEVEVARIVRKFAALYDMHEPSAGPEVPSPENFTPL
jgi:hypothetical protein